MLPNLGTQNLFSAIHGDAQNHIGLLGHIAVIFLYLAVNVIHENEGIDAFQRPGLPSVDLRYDLFRNLTDQLRRDFYVVEAFDLLGNIPLAHAAGVQRQNFVFHALGIAVVFADGFRLVVALPVPEKTRRLMKAVVPVGPNYFEPREKKHKTAKYPQNKNIFSFWACA